tara:strand:- start:6670 stop:6849 length:180 start_codon:yes stop_codon:yes gene_type:complete
MVQAMVKKLQTALNHLELHFKNNIETNPTGSTTVSIRISMTLNTGDEDIAFDNILIRDF